MTYSLDFHPKAEEELFEAIDYLDDQREGYGALLAEAAANLLERIEKNPEQFPATSNNPRRRRALLPNPFQKTYSIYFDLNDQRILIISFFNNRRDPGIWQERI